MTGDDTVRATRRATLGALAGAASLSGCSFLRGGDDAATTRLDREAARELAARFAPVIYFDEHERWFPTDPRPYESERNGGTVVDGFDALDGYAERYDDPGSPPDPTVFYHALRYDGSPLAAVEFWLYSAFDQFATNFHWHDWEVLHAFVDTETDEPQLYVASSHSRKVPNNEFLDPEPGRVPAVLSELGSHSSALSINDDRERFQRLPGGDTIADITNRAIEGIRGLDGFPAAYGLPRDEGFRLPYLVPELDGEPVYDHERLPSVDRSDLIDRELTVRSFDALASPPDLPARDTGLAFGPEGRDREGADVEYDLAPAAELEHIEDFAGPQLSFEFAVPGFAEDAVAGHITTTSVPWETPRYEDPLADISDPTHRAALADRYDAVGGPAPVGAVVAAVTEAVSSDAAPDSEGLTTREPTVEAVALLESDPAAVPTFGGVAVARGVPEGEHRLVVNGPGLAPHSEAVSVTAGDAPAAAGVGGTIPLVARRDAIKLGIDPRGADSDLSGLAVEDDFAGRLYDAPLSGPDAVYVHRGGAYTTEVRDAADEIGAFRVNPTGGGPVRIDEPRTGKASLAGFLAAIAEETRADVDAAADGDSDDGDGGERQGGGPENAVRGLSRALAAVAEAARRAEERAEAGDRGEADAAIGAVRTRLDRVADRLSEARGELPGPRSRATSRRLDQARRRSEQALAADKL